MKIGTEYEIIYTVQPGDLAKALSIDERDQFPEVFATSRMIALMELAAARLMQPALSGNELSVGVNVNINHFAATPCYKEVRASSLSDLGNYQEKSPDLAIFRPIFQ